MSDSADDEGNAYVGHRQLLLADYERTCSVVNQLTDVRFKLVAFVPLVTGAGVALLTNEGAASDTRRIALSLGGVVFVVALTIYDLRNSGRYNASVSRARKLERALDLPTFEANDDENKKYGGLFRSYRSSDINLRDARRNTFWHIPVRHGVGLALAYTAAFGVWVWSLSEAIRGWLDITEEWSEWVPIVLAVLAGVPFYLRHRTIDPDEEPADEL